jgi:tRNA 2-thiouridine synthesizing protein A
MYAAPLGPYSRGMSSSRTPDARPPRPPGAAVVPDERWDAGALGCGDLVLELRRRILAMRPGAILEVVARDAGAPEDLPSWCRMTGHALLSAAPPTYLIRRKES